MSSLSQQLENLVLEMPGVVTVFASGPLIARGALELTSGSASRVEVSGGDNDAYPDRIVVSVGLDAAAQAPVTATAIASGIRAALPEGALTEIVVRISSVTGLP